jgi:L-threonate 2-dehydrogenase
MLCLKSTGEQAMPPVVAVIAPGMMGSGVGGRLAQNGVEVRTLLAGRSAATVARAKAAGMIGASDDQIAAADIILSIVPPGEALGLAERLAPALRAAGKKPIYVDCNALHPGTVLRIARVIEEAGATFVDGGIIGGPPTPGSKGTRIYLSGEAAAQVAVLQQYGLEMPVQPGPIGAASAMKMSYAGITKGFTALGAAMMLAATRAGTADVLKQELLASQPALVGWLTRQMPRMYSKAYRWVAEMEEIAEFVGEDPAARQFYEAAARLYERIAADYEGDRQECNALDAFCKPSGTTP